MAQLLQPLLLLVLLTFTLVYQPRGVTSLAYMDVNSLIEVKNSINRDYLKDIWNRQFKTQVKNVNPGILRARKRGKQAGVRAKHQIKNSRVPLLAIILTNAQSVRCKLDDFLEKCLLGRYRTIKYRSTWGRDSFIRQAALKLNKLV